MKITFRLPFQTRWGQKLLVCGDPAELGAWQPDGAAEMHYLPGGVWELHLDRTDGIVRPFTYKYLLQDEGTPSVAWEWGDPRRVEIDGSDVDSLILEDFWRSDSDPENALFSSAFTGVLMGRRRGSSPGTVQAFPVSGGSGLQLRLSAPRVDPDHTLCILGSDESLGEWDEARAVIMDDADYPLWRATVFIETADRPVYYKYGIYDRRLKRVVHWEAGEDRTLSPFAAPSDRTVVVRTDWPFRYPTGPWKGAGLAIPVFSLRSDKGLGVGEFLDLKPLVDWAKRTGMKMIQVLPINDTTSHLDDRDSTPYSAISVLALHPIYLRLEAMGDLPPEMVATIEEERERLNRLTSVDYEAVMTVKRDLVKRIFERDREAFLADEAFQAFFEANRAWLVPYAAFCCLRDRFGTTETEAWESHETYDPDRVAALTAPESPHFGDVALNYFIQFHLHRQLAEAAAYARSQGVVLKGDIPIGVRGQSADAWASPELFHTDRQAGAPPDDFSVIGQNWGFPTYNWQRMEENGFAWWTRRLEKMADYFDAFRVDHILGFFRIWEIPSESVQGVMGYFNPSLPMHRQEIEGWGGGFDEGRFCEPYIRSHVVSDVFGGEADFVAREFLEAYAPGCFRLKPEVDTQKKIKDHFERVRARGEGDERRNQVEAGLTQLASEVLFLRAPQSKGDFFHPRIAFHQTFSYRDLPEWLRRKLDALYIHYFYKRHEKFWADQGRLRLPAVRNATRMLVCGEDLGMVPDSVPGVMSRVGILSLSIERMPKDPTRDFAHPADCPYLCVCSTSSHDMPTLRGWWERDRETTQRFFETMMGHRDGAPYFCEPWVVREILLQHLYSPCMWAVFPIQDLLGMSYELRRTHPGEEQINDPANPYQRWTYRLHISVEELLRQETFNGMVKDLVSHSGRNADY